MVRRIMEKYTGAVEITNADGAIRSVGDDVYV
jgi:hypothetical protein